MIYIKKSLTWRSAAMIIVVKSGERLVKVDEVFKMLRRWMNFHV